MKKVLSLLVLLIASCVVLAGCKGSATKADPNAIKITAVKLGYGLDWLYAIKDAYEAETGNKVSITEAIGNEGSKSIQTEIESHSSDTDIFFDHFGNFYKTIYQGSVISNGVSYDHEFLDLSDLYNAPLEGENGATIKSKMFKEYENYYNLDGKYYGLPWAYGAMGIVRNVDVWNKLGLTDEDIPNTTEELFDLCDKIIELAASKQETSKVAPFIFSLEDEYYSAITPLWAHQYEGITSSEYMIKGLDPNGERSENVYAFDGQGAALRVAEKLIQSEGYQHKASTSLSFTNMQSYFLSGQAVFCANGTWLEIEMSSNYKNASIDFIKTPVVSEIVDKLSFYTGNFADDEKLSELIDYVDGTISTKPDFATEEDVRIVKEARDYSYVSSGAEHIAVIPAYSDKIEEAKDFLKFMYSDKGLKIYYETMKGATLPLSLSSGSYDSNIKLTTFRTSINSLLEEGKTNMYMYSDKSKIYSLGGVNIYFSNGLGQTVCQTLVSKTHTSAEIISENAKYVKSNWSTISKYLG